MQGKAIIAVTGQSLQIQKKQDYACKKVCSVVKATKGKIFADWDEHPSMVNGVRLVVITSTYQVSTVHQRRWPLASVVGRWQAALPVTPGGGWGRHTRTGTSEHKFWYASFSCAARRACPSLQALSSRYPPQHGLGCKTRRSG